MAPEAIKCQVQSKEVDYFAIGVIAHELTMGKRPFTGANNDEIKEKIISNQEFELKETDLPLGFPLELADFINRCLAK